MKHWISALSLVFVITAIGVIMAEEKAKDDSVVEIAWVEEDLGFINLSNFKIPWVILRENSK